MTTHIIAFIFYTLAMLGVIFVAFAVYKKVAFNQGAQSNTKLKINDMLHINQRKSLYVIQYENEKFLIAADIDRTTFLARLNQKNNSNFQQEEPSQINAYADPEQMVQELRQEGLSSKAAMRKILKELNSQKER